MIQAPTLYDLIADLRRQHPTPAAARTLDMLVTELGVTRDNLRDAIANLNSRAIPVGGRPVLDELLRQARAAEMDDLDYPEPILTDELVVEPLDQGQAGIGILLLVSILVVVGLGIGAFFVGLNSILHFH